MVYGTSLKYEYCIFVILNRYNIYYCGVLI